jgi:hypothetical protein
MALEGIMMNEMTLEDDKPPETRESCTISMRVGVDGMQVINKELKNPYFHNLSLKQREEELKNKEGLFLKEEILLNKNKSKVWLNLIGMIPTACPTSSMVRRQSM